MNLSIRLRLGIWHGMVLLLVLAGFGTVAFEFAWRDQLGRIDQELSAQLDLALKAGEKMGEPGDRGPGRPEQGDSFVEGIKARISDNIRNLSSQNRVAGKPYYVVFIDTDGSFIARSDNAPPGISARGVTRQANSPEALIPNTIAVTKWRTRGRWREAYRMLPLGDALLAGVSLDQEWEAMRNRGLVFGIVGLVLLASGVAGGWWLTGRALRSIAEISHTAKLIANGDLTERISLKGASSELQELAVVLNSTFARLEAAFIRQTRFTSDASHELRTPISVILSKTQTVLARERGAVEYQDALRVCQRSANRMRELTEALLLLSRSDSGALAVLRKELDLAELVQDVATSLSALAEEKSLQFDLQLQPAQTMGDVGSLSQVVTNLIHNAVKFSKPGGVIRLKTRRDKGRAMLEVQDNGVGISATDLPHIFERFYRGDQSRTGSGSYGLGLAIARSIVETHGGEIQVESVEGFGARFVVLLP